MSQFSSPIIFLYILLRVFSSVFSHNFCFSLIFYAAIFSLPIFLLPLELFSFLHFFLYLHHLFFHILIPVAHISASHRPFSSPGHSAPLTSPPVLSPDPHRDSSISFPSRQQSCSSLLQHTRLHPNPLTHMYCFFPFLWLAFLECLLPQSCVLYSKLKTQSPSLPFLPFGRPAGVYP